MITTYLLFLNGVLVSEHRFHKPTEATRWEENIYILARTLCAHNPHSIVNVYTRDEEYDYLNTWWESCYYHTGDAIRCISQDDMYAWEGVEEMSDDFYYPGVFEPTEVSSKLRSGKASHMGEMTREYFPGVRKSFKRHMHRKVRRDARFVIQEQLNS